MARLRPKPARALTAPVERAMGIDVSVRKGLDVVILEGNQSQSSVVWAGSKVEVADVAGLLRNWKPAVVCVDSPPGPGSDPRRSTRLCEEQLRRCGVNIFSTPSDPDRFARPFYDWIRVGKEVFDAAREAGYKLQAVDGEVRERALEVFPHASDVFLRGCLPPSSVRRRVASRRRWRAATLKEAGVDLDGLCVNARGDITVDSIDAALAGLTGLFALVGDVTAHGKEREWIVVPGPQVERLSR